MQHIANTQKDKKNTKKRKLTKCGVGPFLNNQLIMYSIVYSVDKF